MSDQEISPVRLINFDEVRSMVSLSRATIFRYEKAGRFPARVQAGQRHVRWVLSEIVEWIENLPRVK